MPPLSSARIGFTAALFWTHIGLACLIAAFAMAAAAHQRRPWPARSLVLVFLLWAAPLLLSPPMFSDDIYDYVAAGVLQTHHLDPYLVGPHLLPAADRVVRAVSPAWTRTPTPYGPGMLLLARSVATATGDHDIAAVSVTRLISVAGALACLPLLQALGRRIPEGPPAPLYLFVLNPLTITTVASGGHNDTLMLAPMLGAYLAWRHRHPDLAMVLLAAAADVKVVAALGVVVLAADGYRQARQHGSVLHAGRAGARLLARGLAAFTITTTVLGLPLGRGLAGGWGWTRDLGIPGRVLTAITPTDALYGLLGGPDGQGRGQPRLPAYAQPELAHARTLATLVFLAVAAWLVARAAGRTPEPSTGLILLAFLICGTVVWPWYLLWPLAFLACAGSRRQRLAISALSLAMLFIDSPGGPTLYGDPRHFPGREPAELITVTGLGLLLAGLLVPAPSRRRPRPLTPTRPLAAARG